MRSFICASRTRYRDAVFKGACEPRHVLACDAFLGEAQQAALLFQRDQGAILNGFKRAHRRHRATLVTLVEPLCFCRHDRDSMFAADPFPYMLIGNTAAVDNRPPPSHRADRDKFCPSQIEIPAADAAAIALSLPILPILDRGAKNRLRDIVV